MRKLSIFLFLLICAGVGSYLALTKDNKTEVSLYKTTVVPSLTVAPSPTQVPVQDMIVDSSDGTMKLRMHITPHNNGTATYTFFSFKATDTDAKEIFSKTLDMHDSMSIPSNSWSPDNKYVFLKESNQAGQHVYVFKTTGEPFSGGQHYEDVVDLFDKHDISYNFVDATGWADSTLLILTTSTQNGMKGPLFWFIVTSQGFLQLAR